MICFLELKKWFDKEKGGVKVHFVMFLFCAEGTKYIFVWIEPVGLKSLKSDNIQSRLCFWVGKAVKAK